MEALDAVPSDPPVLSPMSSSPNRRPASKGRIFGSRFINHSTVLLQQQRPSHFDRSDLVRAGQSAGLDRSAPPEEAGRAVGGSSPHRCRAPEPQSLRSSGPRDASPAGGSRTLAVYCSGRSSPAAALAEDRPRPRAGLGRIGCRWCKLAFTACRRCISRREDCSTGIGRCGADM